MIKAAVCDAPLVNVFKSLSFQFSTQKTDSFKDNVLSKCDLNFEIVFERLRYYEYFRLSSAVFDCLQLSSAVFDFLRLSST